MASQHDASSGGTIPETDQTMLRAMVWQAVGRHVEQLRMEGVPAADMARMVDHAMGMLLSVPPDQLTTISLTSPTMMAAVVAGYGSVYGPLSEQQMNQLRAAADTRSPLGQGDAAASGGALWGQPGFPGGGWMSAGRGGMTSSARFEGMPGTAGAPGSYAAYASQYSGMGFDAGTIAAFAAVKLDRETYNDLAKDFDRGRIVDSARAAKTLGLSGSEEVRDVVETDQRFVQAIVALHTAKPADKPAAAAEARNIYEGLTPDEQKQADELLRHLGSDYQNLVKDNPAGPTPTDEAVMDVRARRGDVDQLQFNRDATAQQFMAAPVAEVEADLFAELSGDGSSHADASGTADATKSVAATAEMPAEKTAMLEEKPRSKAAPSPSLG